MYKQNEVRMETAGSLTPQLEGAPHSTAHAVRSPRLSTEKPQSKGGNRHS